MVQISAGAKCDTDVVQTFTVRRHALSGYLGSVWHRHGARHIRRRDATNSGPIQEPAPLEKRTGYGSVAVGGSHLSHSAKASFVVERHAIVCIFDKWSLKKAWSPLPCLTLSPTGSDPECFHDAIKVHLPHLRNQRCLTGNRMHFTTEKVKADTRWCNSPHLTEKRIPVAIESDINGNLHGNRYLSSPHPTRNPCSTELRHKIWRSRQQQESELLMMQKTTGSQSCDGDGLACRSAPCTNAALQCSATAPKATVQGTT